MGSKKFNVVRLFIFHFFKLSSTTEPFVQQLGVGILDPGAGGEHDIMEFGIGPGGAAAQINREKFGHGRLYPLTGP